MLNRVPPARSLIPALFLALAAPAWAQPAVPAAPSAPGAPPAAARPAPAPAPSAADAPPSASDLPPSTAPTASAPVAAAAPRPAPSADDPPTTDFAPAPRVAPPTATASAAPAAGAPAATAAPDAPPTAAAEEAPAPPPESLQTVARNYPLTPEGNAAFLAAYRARPDVTALPSGVMYRVLVPGKGTVTPISRLDTVTVSYRGWLIDGTSFDNSPPGNPRAFQLAALIEGWREALLKMKVGDVWEVVVPASLAYGAEGRAGRIPPNQTLIFVISVAKIEYAG